MRQIGTSHIYSSEHMSAGVSSGGEMVKYNVHLTHFYDMRMRCQYSAEWTVARQSINFIRKRNASSIVLIESMEKLAFD